MSHNPLNRSAQQIEFYWNAGHQRARWAAEEQWHPQQQGQVLKDGS